MEYRLDPGAIEFLAEESRLLGLDAAASVVCSILNGGPLKAEQRSNVADFISRTSEDERVKRAYLRTLKRFGRCPDGERKWLRSTVQPPEAGPARDALETAQPQPRGELVLVDLRGSVDTLPQVFNRISQLPSPLLDLTIRLGDFTYATTLAVLAQLVLSRGLQARYVVDCNAEMRAYLARIGFNDALRNLARQVSPDPMDWAVGLTRISAGTATEEVTGKIVDIIGTFVNLPEQERSSLFILVAEMVENIHRHSNSPVDGFAVAQVYPQKLKMGITFVDGGIGIRRSFEEGQPSVDISGLRDDAQFLERACDLHVTSKASGHSGYGLYLLSRVVANNRGTFILSSGSATVVAYLKRDKVVFDRYSHGAWQGTVVSVILNLHQRISTLDVYKTMPVPKEWEVDELFE